DPAGLRHVNHDPVRPTVLDLNVAVLLTPMAHTQRLIHIIARLRAGFRQLFGDRLQALDLETNMVNATPLFAAFGPGYGIALEIEDGQIDIPVTEVVPLGPRTIELGDFLHAEHFDIEFGGLIDILRRDSDVLNLWHGVSPVPMGSCWVSSQGKTFLNI